MEQIIPQNKNVLPASIILSIFLGMAFTLVGYTYGTGNQIEQLPIVYRAINPSFLVNDFFVNASSSYGPRFYFAHFIALLTNIPHLPFLYLFLTIMANISVSLITFFFGRYLFKSNMAGLLASCIVMIVDGFNLGGAAIIRSNVLTPDTLIMPLILLSIWAAIKDRPILSVILAGAGSLFQSLLGLETGGIMLLTVIISRILQRYKLGMRKKINVGSLIVALLLLIIFAGISIIPEAFLQNLNSSQFIFILAYFRHPHHYIPSTWGPYAYLEALSFFIASGFAWYETRKHFKQPLIQIDNMLIVTLIVFLLCIGGYLFVEVVPSRLWTEAQTFRFLLLPKWLGEVMIAGVITHYLTEGGDTFFSYVFLAGTFLPIAIGVPPLVRVIRNWTRKLLPFAEVCFGSGPTLLFVIILFYLFGISIGGKGTLLIFVFILLILVLLLWPQKYFYAGFAIGICCLLLFSIFREQIRNSSIGSRSIPPQITLSELSGNDIDVAKYARDNTESDGIFLTPPDFGQFRLTAERAIVVDFKAFPFQEPAMQTWYNRLTDCYGVPKLHGFSMLTEMDKNYRNIDDAKLRLLQAKYNITYAVLYTETKSIFPVLFQNEEYKIVILS